MTSMLCRSALLAAGLAFAAPALAQPAAYGGAAVVASQPSPDTAQEAPGIPGPDAVNPAPGRARPLHRRRAAGLL